eukprot:m.275942 g.275942  ORF g.275942 m.275942 type:complete len:686 (-) comp15702_c0_seq1:150-2207(-)
MPSLAKHQLRGVLVAVLCCMSIIAVVQWMPPSKLFVTDSNQFHLQSLAQSQPSDRASRVTSPLERSDTRTLKALSSSGEQQRTLASTSTSSSTSSPPSPKDDQDSYSPAPSPPPSSQEQSSTTANQPSRVVDSRSSERAQLPRPQLSGPGAPLLLNGEQGQTPTHHAWHRAGRIGEDNATNWQELVQLRQDLWSRLPEKIAVSDNDASHRGWRAKFVYDTFYDISRLRCDTEMADVRDAQSPCSNRIHELIAVVDAHVAKDPVDNAGGWGIMFFLQMHKLIAHDLLQMPVTACGVGSPDPSSLHSNWVDREHARVGPSPLRFRRTVSFERWHTSRHKLQPTTYLTLWCPLEKQTDESLAVEDLPERVDTVVSWDAQQQKFVHGDKLVNAVTNNAFSLSSRPWLRLGVMSCGKECLLYADHPVTLPARFPTAPVATVVAVTYGTTPMLPYYLDYHKRHFGITHHTIYYIDGWEYAPGGPKQLPSEDEYNITLIPWNFKLQGYYFAQALAHIEAIYRHRGTYEYVLNFDLDELLVWQHDVNLLKWLRTATRTQTGKVPGCFDFARFNTRRNCDSDNNREAAAIQAEDMIQRRLPKSLPHKIIYDPLRASETTPHGCTPQVGYKTVRFTYPKAYVAHVARHEPNATTCQGEKDEAVVIGAKAHIARSSAEGRAYILREKLKAQKRWSS